ncbi:hypothetical protein EYZ11_008068 [Aspergillus tanneri]|nr:hypothetical protein EYZ11_008068 [Aspergillus tanneri]
MVRQIDITSPSFIDHMVDIARNGDSKRVWTLIRLIRCHTPLKIALSKAWHGIPEPSKRALVRYYPEARSADCPDPHAALEMIHSLAISLSCSKNLSPRRAYSLIHWLYVFLLKHGAPVKPVIVRAMYHAGVIRYRQEGLHVSRTQYTYIMDCVKKAEDPQLVAVLTGGSQVGITHQGSNQLEDEYIYV